ncbi:MAG: heparinase II/III family protein [Bryobacteraceae bacterium]
MNRRSALRLLAAASFGSGTSPTRAWSRSDALDPLTSIPLKPHPRLLASADRIAEIRRLVRRDPIAKGYYADLRDQAHQMLSQRPIEYKLIGPRLLDKSRTCLQRVYVLALLWRLDQRPEYLRRALSELRAATAFPDWHPPHFLDVAEMTHAFAIGYDWLFEGLAQPDRDLLAKAIIEKGLDPGLAAYASRAFWVAPHNNWNQVCNGGLGLGALAIGDVDKDKANAILNNVLSSLPPAMLLYAPDGGWIEGPGYWAYATQYAVNLIAGLEGSLGRDYGLSESAGFRHTGDFRLQSTGPLGLAFNYADAYEQMDPVPQLSWLSTRFEQPAYAWQERTFASTKGEASPLDLVWFPSVTKSPEETGFPLAQQFRGANAAFIRSSWTDPNALYVGAKGGDNAASHAHLDLGSFVFDAAGVRWAMDLGPDDYNLPDYFGKKRWTYYRLRTESHNTLLIDNDNQSETAKASLHLAGSSIEIDLADAYPDRLRNWRRQLSFLDDQTLRIVDEVAATRPIAPVWGMVTSAGVEISDRKATLRKDGKTLLARIESPETARFDTVSTRVSAPQNPNAGTTKLVVRLPEPSTEIRIDVRLTLNMSGD